MLKTVNCAGETVLCQMRPMWCMLMQGERAYNNICSICNFLWPSQQLHVNYENSVSEGDGCNLKRYFSPHH